MMGQRVQAMNVAEGAAHTADSAATATDLATGGGKSKAIELSQALFQSFHSSSSLTEVPS